MGNFLIKQTVYNEYGWLRDLPDIRDKYKIFSEKQTKSVSSKFSLRNMCPPIYNQGDLGSCTANAVATAFEYHDMKTHPADAIRPSRLFLYYHARKLQNTESCR